MNFFNELKRRNVFRMAGVCGVIGWLLIQVSATVKGPLHLPEWIDTLVILAVIGGFPIALLFSWAYEVTPDGLKRTADVPENASVAAQTAKRRDIITIGGLTLVLAVIVVDRFLLPKQAPAIIVRINVPLIDGATDKHLWAEIYDREMTVANVFDIRPDITETIAGALKVMMNGEEKAAIPGFEHVVSVSPNDATNLATLAQTYQLVGEWRK